MNVAATIACPVCGRLVRESETRAVMLAHADGVGKPCPFSGQPCGGTATQ